MTYGLPHPKDYVAPVNGGGPRHVDESNIPDEATASAPGTTPGSDTVIAPPSAVSEPASVTPSPETLVHTHIPDDSTVAPEAAEAPAEQLISPFPPDPPTVSGVDETRNIFLQ